MKRVLSLLLTVTLLVSTLTSCSLQHFSFGEDNKGNIDGDNATDEVYITRIEWAEMLGLCFGMDTPTEEQAHFSDVKEDDFRFPYVQACAEWGVFGDSSTRFDPNSPASIEFAVASAIVASEMEMTGVVDKVAFAIEKGLVLKGTSYIDEEDAQNILLWALEQYRNKPFVEYNHNVYKENVINLVNDDTKVVEYSEGTIVIYGESNEIAVGDVIIVYEDAQKGIETARKVTEVGNLDGQTTLQTVAPEFEEVFETLDFAAIAIPDVEDIVPSQTGVKIVKLNNVVPTSLNEGNASVVTLASTGNKNAVALSKTKVPDFGVEINLTKGELVPNIACFDWFNIEMSQGQLKDTVNEKTLFEEGTTITDAWGNILYNNTQKFTAGYEIIGSLKVSDFYIESICKTKKVLGIPYQIERLENEVHFTVESSLSVKGYIKGEQELFRTFIPIPGGAGLGVEVVFNLCVEANGEISVKAIVENSSNVTITGKKVKKTNDTDASIDVDMLQIDIWSGIEAEATLLWGWTNLKLVDVSAKAGCGMEVTPTIHTANDDRCMICIDASAYFPTLSISLGMDTKTLANKLGIKFNFSIIGKSGASIKSFVTPICHYEISEDGKRFVDKCSWADMLNKNDAESDENLNSEIQYDPSTMMNISSYSIFVNVGEEKELSVVQIPYGYEASDIRFVSQSSDIVQVELIEGRAACVVIGKSVGSTIIVVETKDGKHSFSCAVMVTE